MVKLEREQARGRAQRRPRVLLVEDSAISQILAFEMLTALGCDAVLAPDGEQAIENIGRESYDLVLMDCELPGIDGLEAARRIRGHQSVAGERGQRAQQVWAPTPIVALTANDLDSQRQLCVAAGMNDFLTKPLSLRLLGGVLRRWLPGELAWRDPAELGFAAPAGDEAAAPSLKKNAAEDLAIDRRALDKIRVLQRPNAPDLVAQVIESYRTHAPKLLQRLHDAVRDHDALAVKDLAHSLKSSSANVGALGLAGYCKELEMSARLNDLSSAGGFLDALNREYEVVAQLLAKELSEGER